MDTKKIEKYINTFGLPVLTVVAGLILLVNPDGAAALVTKLIGWLFVICGAVKLLVPTLKKQPMGASDWIVGGLLILAGILLLSRPMILADGIGRFFGILLVIEGFSSFRKAGFTLLTVLTIAAGAALFVMPRTLTQTVLAICGIILIAIGIINLLSKRNEIKRLKNTSDPNIIDADM